MPLMPLMPNLAAPRPKRWHNVRHNLNTSTP